MQYILFLAILLFARAPIFTQETRGFEIPQSYIRVLVMTDPKCPLQISGPFKVIGYRNGGLRLGYSLRNASNSNIETFEIEEVNWAGSSGYNIPAVVNSGRTFKPGLEVSSLEDVNETELGAFDAEFVRTSRFSAVQNRFWIVTVLKVTLSDGTKYDASERLHRLTKFLDEFEVDIRIPKVQLRRSERRLKEFLITEQR